jgi:hypothetical protein
MIRTSAEIDGGVDVNSPEYRNGSWATEAFGCGGLAYAGLAKGGSILASSGAAASTFRSNLRTAFGGGKNLRPPKLSKYDSDSALRAAAGRTNFGANGYGAATAATGALNANP